MNGNSRKQGLEQFYTIGSVAEYLTNVAVGIIGSGLDWVEPTAGKGAFVDALYGIGESVTAYDIDPKHESVIQCDILTDTPDVKGKAVIGNPPFGRACSLAVKIFNALANGEAQYIAFIIPPSFRKTSILDKLHPKYHLIYTTPVPRVAFEDADGKVHDGGHLKTEFHIYKRLQHDRPKFNNYRSKEILFVRKSDNPDIAIRTHGSYAGQVLDGTDYNPRTTAFIKLKSERALNALKNADYSYWLNATSYIPCISPAEISYSVDEYIKVHSTHET
jgi:hypothetical protein